MLEEIEEEDVKDDFGDTEFFGSMEKPTMNISLASARNGHDLSNMKSNKVAPSLHDAPNDPEFFRASEEISQN